MLDIIVSYLDDKDKEELIVSIEEGSDILGLLGTMNSHRKPEDYFYIVNGSIELSSYKLKRGDRLKIFPAMCGG